MGGLAEGHLGTLPGVRRPQGTLWGGCRGCGPSPCWLGGQWTPAHDGGARGQGTLRPCPWPVIYGTRAELGDAPGTLGRAEWVGRNSTAHSVDLLLEAQVWSPREVVGSWDSQVPARPARAPGGAAEGHAQSGWLRALRLEAWVIQGHRGHGRSALRFFRGRKRALVMKSN